MDLLSLVQWPAMVVTIVASYLVASSEKGRRAVGFWIFLASNVLWVIWGWHAGAYALIALQFALCAMNIRGAQRNASEGGPGNDEAVKLPSLHGYAGRDG